MKGRTAFWCGGRIAQYLLEHGCCGMAVRSYRMLEADRWLLVLTVAHLLSSCCPAAALCRLLLPGCCLLLLMLRSCCRLLPVAATIPLAACYLPTCYLLRPAGALLPGARPTCGYRGRRRRRWAEALIMLHSPCRTHHAALIMPHSPCRTYHAALIMLYSGWEGVGTEWVTSGVYAVGREDGWGWRRWRR